MSQQYPSNWKVCATCAYWAGRRESDYFGQRVTVSSPMDKGKCAGPVRCGYKGQDKQADSHCGEYQKWLVLK